MKSPSEPPDCEYEPPADSSVLRRTPQSLGRQRLRPPQNLVYFEAVVRHGSIRKAAEALRIASSALNRRILDLEDEVGSALFERLPRGVRLTAAGELYLTYARRSIKDLQALETQIEGLRRQMRGAVHIAVAESVTPSLLPRAIQTYQAGYPHVVFHVTVAGPERLVEVLLDDHVDLILTHESPEKPSVSVIAAARHPVCAFMVPGHPLGTQESVQLSDCLHFPLAVPDPSLAARSLLELACEQLQVPFVPAIESNSIETLKTFARLGEAVCFSFNIGEEARDSGLVARPLRDQHCAEAHLYLAARRGRVLPVAAAAFAEQLKDSLSGDTAHARISAV
jgi:DNA-binding transcriptional LysR family regulator